MARANETAVGVDACPYGWLATRISGVGITIERFREFEELCRTYEDATRILVDIPIGLPTESRRECDGIVKDLLGCRGISVFYPPCEAVIDIDDYDEANTTHRDRMGHGLSQQAYGLREKIREVRDVVGERYDGLVRESHPELCFYALNGQPIAYPKSSERGREFRLELLNTSIYDAEREYQSVVDEIRRKDVRRDDILDSMMLAVAARSTYLQSVP